MTAEAHIDREGAGPDVDFYVQATRDAGMGHLSRAGSVAKQLASAGLSCLMFLDADECGSRFARTHGFPVSAEFRATAEIVVIDALDVSDAMAEVLAGYQTRVLISPSFYRANLATHVLIREAPRALLDSLEPGTHLEIDPRFAFATAQGARMIEGQFERLRVGLCLSGGRGTLEGPLLRCLLREDEVEQVTTIADIDVSEAEPYGARLRHTNFAIDPWAFLAGTNVFVAGDGVMVSEAVARAIPTFSVTSRERLHKNAALVEAGVIEPILVEELDCADVRERVVDRSRLTGLHQASRQYFHPSMCHALADSIRRIREDHG